MATASRRYQGDRVWQMVTLEFEFEIELDCICVAGLCVCEFNWLLVPMWRKWTLLVAESSGIAI
jgi:hypothetical protein